MTLEDIVAREEIKQVKARYCYHLDHKEWDAYANLFTRDATLVIDTAVSTRGRAPNSTDEVRGRDAIKASVSGLLVEADTVHQVHSPIIELTSATTAKVIWAMEDIVRMPGFFIEARGHYRESYVVEGGAWRIASLHLTRTWINLIEGGPGGPV